MISSVSYVFDFIVSLMDTIVSAIVGVSKIFLNTLNIVLDFSAILPGELYYVFNAFVSIIFLIYIYKFIRG